MVAEETKVDARIRMIVAAEQLVAERGVAAVSLREVGAAAGQRNNSAVQYHFGTKAGLIDAVFAQRMGPIDSRRWTMLREIDAAARNGELRVLVEALVRPLAESIVGTHDGPSWYARFIAQVMVAEGQTSSSRIMVSSVAEVYARMDRCLAGAVPARLQATRLWLSGIYLVNALAERERVDSEGGQRRGLELSPSDFVVDLIDTTTGLLLAPSGAAPRRRPLPDAGPARAHRGARTATSRRS